MIQCLDFPIMNGYAGPFGWWIGLEQKLQELGIDGLDGAWVPGKIDQTIPAKMLIGSHVATLPDWLDYFRQDKQAILRKFGTWERAQIAYSDTDLSDPYDAARHYRMWLWEAVREGVQFVSFPVFDYSFEECWSYEWVHDDYKVLDGAIEIINFMLKDVEPTFDFLVENSWWPGFKFTEPEKTEYLLSRISYPRVGIMLNTARLLNTNLSTFLRSQKAGVAYIRSMIQMHGALSESIKGIRLALSLSGRYVRQNTFPISLMKMVFPEEYLDPIRNEADVLISDRLSKIDLRLPWGIPEIAQIVEEVSPDYLVHGIQYDPNATELPAVKKQQSALKRGQSLCE